MAKKLKYANEDVVVGYAVKDDKGNKLSDAVIKANNSLQLPETAPTKTKLVGVGADKSQIFIDIGDGFTLENNTLKVSGSSGEVGGLNVTQEVLWTNPNPAKSFAAQDVSLNDNISDYDYIYCCLQISKTNVTLFSQIYYVADFVEKKIGMIHSEFSNKWAREISYIDDNTLHWGNGNYNGSGDSNYAIPVKIIGIKFLDILDYSTEEQYTGKHWIDGKKIYQMTVNCGNISASNKDVTVAVNNVEYITSVSGICKTTANEFLSVGYNNSGNIQACFNLVIDTITPTSLMLKINVGSLINATSTYITIEYTKTT